MDKQRSCANCGRADHHVAECTTYKQGVKTEGYTPDDEDRHESGRTTRVFFGIIFPLVQEAVENQNHPKHKLALAAVLNTTNRQAEKQLQKEEGTSGELTIEIRKERDAGWAKKKSSRGINYEKVAAEAINKLKQDLATKDIEQRLKQEIESQQRKEKLSMATSEHETSDNLTVKNNCNTLKMAIGKSFGIAKI